MHESNSGLSRKITLLCLIMAAVICAGTCAVGYITYRNSLYQTYNRFAYEVGDAALTYVDGNTITGYLDTMEIDTKYEEMARHIRVLHEHLELAGIYISVMDPEALTLTNIYDTRVHDAEDPSAFELGAVDPISADVEDSVNVFLTGERSSNYFIRKSRFGYNTSAILPVQNDAGQVVAVLAVDVPMPNIIQNLNRYLLLTVAITALLGLVILSLVLSYLRRRVIAPIQLLTASAEGFASSRTGFSQDALNICTGDEVETLARALSKMERDITRYIENLAAVTAEKERIGAELSIATQIQADMLPSIFPAFPERGEFDIYATMTPAKEVGGDFYDFFMVDERHLAVVIADVSGKGVPAALFMVIGKTLIKDHTLPGADLGEVFSQVNELLCEANREGLFITAFEGVLDLATGQLRFVNAGHEPPFLYTSSGHYALQKVRPGFVLAGMEGLRYRPGSIALSPGDKLFLYTDGVTEATSPDQELYGMERLGQALERGRDLPPRQLLPAIKADIDAFVGGAEQFDDITMLCLAFKQRMAGGEKDSPDTRELTLDASLSSIPVLTQFVNDCLAAHHCPMKVQTQLDISIDELFSNIANYAYAPETGQATVRVSVDGDPPVVTITFIDCGIPYNPLIREAPDVTLSAEERQTGGLGIFMARKIMDDMTYEYRDGQNILAIRKFLSYN